MKIYGFHIKQLFNFINMQKMLYVPSNFSSTNPSFFIPK